MRRGHTFGGLLAIFAAAAALTGAPTALADGGTPGDICQQVASGTISPDDPIVQGYCGPIVTVTPPTTVTTPSTVTPPVVTPPTAAPTVIPTAAPTTGVAGVSHTIVARTPAPTAAVKGAQHTVRAPVSASAPLATAKVSGTLPFTGAQLGLFALVGLALLATGLVLRSTGRRPSAARTRFDA